MLSDRDRFWIGPKWPEAHVVGKMQSSSTEKRWYATPDSTELDPDYSEFSVRIHDPNTKTLSFVNNTIAILPKSRLRSIYNLIGALLDEADVST